MQNTNEVPNSFNGLNLDASLNSQPNGSYRFALNAVEETIDGNKRKISNEPSNFDSSAFTNGFFPVGDVYLGDNTSCVICINPLTNRTEIGIIDKDSKYYMHVSTLVLGIKINNQCDIVYRLRRNNERVIYWVDGKNVLRTFNFDKPYNFYNNDYKNYIRAGGNPNTYLAEKWDKNSFDLIKSYKSIPTFNNVEIIETGNIIPGSYNFAIQMVDEDLNPTAWITTSNTVNIYNDSINNAYETIRGSRNVTNDAQSFSRASKSIKLTISNLDNTFPYYRVAIIRATGGVGQPTDVLASELYSTSNGNFLYTGNDANLKVVSIGDILIDQEVIFAPRHIEQLENRLIVAHTKGKNLNLCEFQKFASKIKTDVVFKEVLLNNIQSEANIKNAKSTFLFGGYMPGEIYSFGISYVFPDYVTPSYHITGKNILDTTSKFQYHEIDDRYLDIHNCSTNNYWGVDAKGQTLLGKKIRHHKFPFRKNVNKPLVTTNSNVTNITKYRLTLTFALNPAWTPGPPSYPTDNGTPPLPLVIGYTINYQKNGGIGTNSFNSQLVDTDVSSALQITIYDDVTPLDIVSAPLYYAIESTSQLATYQDGVNNRFIITQSYTSYTASSSINNDVAEIFGIRFDNIEKPHPDCIGFYITRNERTDDDKTIIDNAIFGSMTEFEQYKSFGLLAPKQYYTANNCGKIDNANKTLQYFDKGVWFFNPEFQFFQKKTEFDEIVIEGTYTETSQNMPTISNINGSTCNAGGSRGLYVEDVQAGTSYNPDINKKKDKDDDGFDLIIGYRNINVAFTVNNSGISLPVKLRVLYINAANYQNFDNNTYYNVSIDNKIGMYITNSDITQTYLRNTGANTNKWLYGSLVKNSTSSYSNFLTRNYYKEHNNPVLFNNLNVINNLQIFNGDTDISAINLVSSVYYDIVAATRAKKNRTWSIIVGAVLVVAGAVLLIAGGTGAIAISVGVSSLLGLAVSYGVSLAMSGIKFEQMKAMVDVDYEKGLKNTIEDGGVYETIRNNLSTQDDTFRWFADRISNLYIESSVPVGLRSGLTSGVPDFIDAPSPYNEERFRNQLREKLTVLDRQQGSGRLYKGYATSEFYDVNKDYLRFNKEKIFIHLPLEYDCCSSNNEEYPVRRWYSQQSFQEEKTDNYGVFLPNNYNDMEGETGEITDLARLGNNLYVFTKEGVWQQPANLQERVTNEIVSFIGTGDFLSIPPRKVLDSEIGVGGTQHKWATLKTPFGIFYISEIENKPYILSESAKDISEENSSYFRENIKSFLFTQLYNKHKVEFLHENNPANPDGIGYISNYDTKYKRVLLTKRDYLLLPDKLAILVIRATKPTVGTNFCYCLEDGKFYNGITKISLNNNLFFEDRSFTMSYSIRSDKWISWHSYIPNYYIYTQESFYYFIYTSNKIWKHYKEGSYTIFNNISYPFILEYIKTNQYQDTILNSVMLQTIARKWDANTKDFIEDRFTTFNKIVVSNNKHCTGELTMIVKDTQPSPQNWYQQQIKNTNNSILITKKGNNWNINNFRNYVDDYTKPIFSKAWDELKDNFFIDKVVNNSIINRNKNWHELENFTGQFISIRLKFDTFNDVNLIVNYTVEFDQISDR